jgi:hypothetical protein
MKCRLCERWKPLRLCSYCKGVGCGICASIHTGYILDQNEARTTAKLGRCGRNHMARQPSDPICEVGYDATA